MSYVQPGCVEAQEGFPYQGGEIAIVATFIYDHRDYTSNDVSGKHSPESTMNPRYVITDTIAHGLTRIERARGFLEGAQLSAEWIQQMRERAVLLETHHSTHIEGTRLTLSDSAKLLAGKPAPDADAEDVRELLNYREALSLVAEYLDSGTPITEALIRSLHARLVVGVRAGQAQPGAYRTVQNYVVNSLTSEIIYTPPTPGDVPLRMGDLVTWLNDPGDRHPVLVSGIAQFELVDIHPFIDGNGRTSRLLSTLVLYRAGYDFKRLFTISEYYDRDRDAFYHAIQGVRDAGLDMTGWLEYFVTGLATQLDEVRDRGSHARQVAIIVRDHRLNQRQAAALSHIVSEGLLTIQDLEAICPDVSRRTLQRDLKELIDLKLITSEGATNRLVYRLDRK